MLEDYKYIYNILSGLKLEKIHITKLMVAELSKVLNSNNDFIKCYLITKIEDLFNIKIINFYYFLLKYIFKNSYHYFYIPILLNIRNIIIFIIRNNLNSLCYFKLKYEKDTELIERVDYIIKTITDNEYYYVKYNNNFILCKLKAILFIHLWINFQKKNKTFVFFSNDLYRDEQDKRKEVKTVKYSVFI